MSWERNTGLNVELYQAQLEAIISAPLTPDNINTYADVALGQLVSLVGRAIEDYQLTVDPTDYATTRELEDAALSFFGLQNIETTLDNIDEVARSIDQLDTVIDRSEQASFVITPPEPDSTLKIVHGPGASPTEKRPELRLKTALFVLQQDFEVDVYNPEELRLMKGIVNKRMFRSMSYHQITIPQLERMILVCDQPQNVTFVLDTRILESLGITGDQVAQMTKAQLNSLLDSNSSLGQRVMYRPQGYVARLRDAVQFPDRPAAEGERQEAYLSAQDTTGVLSIPKAAEELGFDRNTYVKLLNRIVQSGTIPEPQQFCFGFGTRKTPGLSDNHRTAVRQLAEAEGLLTRLPDGAITLNALAKRLGVSYQALKTVADRLEEAGSMGKLPVFGPRKTLYVQEHDIDAITKAYNR